MDVSSPPVSASPSIATEPPLSPGAAPAPPAEISPSPALSLEAKLVRFGLVTPDQMATAMREEAETGRALAQVVVANGWVSPENLARVQEPAQVEPPAPAATPTQAPAPSSVTARVFVHLTNGERIEVGAYDGEQAAEARARELIAQLGAEGEWPQLAGRYVRPDAVVSIDVDLTV